MSSWAEATVTVVRSYGVSVDTFSAIVAAISTYIAEQLQVGKSVLVPALGTFFADISGSPIFLGTVLPSKVLAKPPASPGKINTILIATRCKQRRDHVQSVIKGITAAMTHAIRLGKSDSFPLPGLGTLLLHGSSRTLSCTFEPHVRGPPRPVSSLASSSRSPFDAKGTAAVTFASKISTSKPTVRPPPAPTVTKRSTSLSATVRTPKSVASTPVKPHGGSSGGTPRSSGRDSARSVTSARASAVPTPEPSTPPGVGAEPPSVQRPRQAKGFSSLSAVPPAPAAVMPSFARGVKFTDPEFPPNRTSLCRDWSLCVASSTWSKLVWKRASEFCGSDVPFIFYDGIDPGDVAQGILGDCYFLSALSVLAEHPDRIRKLFITQEGNYEGRYQVTWYQNGTPIVVTIDDYFPCDPVTGQPAFTHCNGPELWVMLLEKAWAKVHGGYLSIEGGVSCDVLTAFTGAPSQTFKILPPSRSRRSVDHEIIWAAMLHAEQEQFVTVGVVPDDPSVDLQAAAGLVENHCYGVLDVREVGDNKLIKLRNPWGNTEWKGDWSDNSSKWTPELKDALGWTDVDDGSFWMEWRDFSKYFCEVSVVRVRDGFVNNTVPLLGLGLNHLTAVELAVARDSTVCVELHQSAKRCFPDEEFTFQYGGLIFEVISLSPPAIVGTSRPLQSTTTSIDLNLSAGRYLIVCRGSVDRKRHVAVSTYSSAPVKLTPLRTVPTDLEDLLAPVYRAVTLANGKPLDFSGPFAGIDAFEFSTAAIACIAYTNNTPKNLTCMVNVDLTNMAIVSHSSRGVFLSLPPGGTATIVCRVIRPEEAPGYGYKHEDVVLRLL